MRPARRPRASARGRPRGGRGGARRRRGQDVGEHEQIATFKAACFFAVRGCGEKSGQVDRRNDVESGVGDQQDVIHSGHPLDREYYDRDEPGPEHGSVLHVVPLSPGGGRAGSLVLCQSSHASENSPTLTAISLGKAVTGDTFVERPGPPDDDKDAVSSGRTRRSARATGGRRGSPLAPTFAHSNFGRVHPPIEMTRDDGRNRAAPKPAASACGAS